MTGTTHGFAFWEGIPDEAKIATGRLFASCPTLHSMVVVMHALRTDVLDWLHKHQFGAVTITAIFPVFSSGWCMKRVCVGGGVCGGVLYDVPST